AAYDHRSVLVIYAALLIVCLPIYLGLLPRTVAQPFAGSDARGESPADAERLLGRPCERRLSLAFAAATAVGAGLSAHLIGTLESVALARSDAVWLAGSIGVMQVLGRALELVGTSRLGSTRLGTLSLAALAS